MGFPFGENRIAVHPEGRKPKLLGVKRDLDRVPPSWPSPRGASHRRARKRAFPARTGSATPVLRDGLRPPQDEGCWCEGLAPSLSETLAGLWVEEVDVRWIDGQTQAAGVRGDLPGRRLDH